MHLQVRLRGFPGVDGMPVTRRRIEFLCGQTILPSRCCHVPAMLIFVFWSAGKQPQSAGGRRPRPSLSAGAFPRGANGNALAGT
jgi:hypothetical protein